MNTLLVYPEFPDTFWGFKRALKFLPGKRATLPPLGLATLGAMLPKDWNLRLIDMNVARLRKLCKKDIAWADVVMISAMSVQRASAENVINKCAQAGKTVIAGGPLFTCEPEQFSHVDHLVLDEAEVTLPRFIADFQNNSAQRIYRAQEFPRLTNTPIPAWHLLNIKRYTSMAVQFSRGCPFDCEFCNVTSMLGRKVRAKTATQMIEELEALYNAGWRSKVFFVDDNFIGSKRYLKQELLPALIEWQKKRSMPFYTEASINLAKDEELMQMMHEAGFDAVFIGIETPDETALALADKKQNMGIDLAEEVRKIQNAGLQVQGGFIVGFDSDNLSTFQQQIDFIQKSNIVTAMVGILQAPPGTRIFERLSLEKRIISQFLGNNVDAITNIIPKMDITVLREGYRRIMEQIYAPKHYYARIRGFLKEYKAPKINAPFNKINIWAFMRACVRLGIIGRERWHYWGLLGWVLWQKIRKRMSMRMFALAVTLAIYGHHFRKLCKRFKKDAMNA